MRRIPHLLLLDAATSAKRLISRGERPVDGAPHDIVEATLQDDTRLSLFLSRNPRDLARVEYAAYIPGLGDSVVAWQWRGWKKNAALGLTPSGHTVEVNGVVFQEVEYSRYEAGSPDAAAMMEIPAGLAPAGARPEIAAVAKSPRSPRDGVGFLTPRERARSSGIMCRGPSALTAAHSRPTDARGGERLRRVPIRPEDLTA